MKIRNGSFLNLPEYFNYSEKLCGNKLPFFFKLKIFIGSLWIMLAGPRPKNNFNTKLRVGMIEFYAKDENKWLLPLLYPPKTKK